MSSGPSEFGGGAGMVQKEQVGHETLQQEVWEIYATNPSGDDGSELLDKAHERIGEPRVTYTPGR